MLDTYKYFKIPLDYYSILEKLGTIEWKPDEVKWEPGNESNTYYLDYADLFQEMTLIASDLSLELDRIVNNFNSMFPFRKKQYDVENYNGTRWFNLCVSMLAETDMEILLKSEEHITESVWIEKELRRKKVRALTKEMQTTLFTEVFNFLLRYLKLYFAYETICSLIDELTYLHSFRERKGTVQLPPVADVI